MPISSWLGITLTAATFAAVSISTIAVVAPVAGQAIRNDDIVTAMRTARGALEQIRQRLKRAERSGEWEDRFSALAEMKKILDNLSPAVESMTGDMELQRKIRREFDQWVTEYKAAEEAGTGDAAKFILSISQRWKQLSQPLQDYSGETHGATFDQLVNDASIRGFGMPNTLAAVRALDSYLLAVQSDPDYARYRTHPSVNADLQRARQSRDEARAKLAEAAKTILDQATVQDLDESRRIRLQQLLETEIVPALAGSGRIEELMARARALLAKPTTQPSEQSNASTADSRLTELADRLWPSFAGRYATATGPVLNMNRGEMVELHNVRALRAEDYVSRDADLVMISEGTPIICVFDPVVKKHVENIMSEAGLKAMPQPHTIIGRVRGMGSVSVVRQPGSTPASTNPAGAEGSATAQQKPSLESRDAVVIDVLAMRGGPVAIGVDPTPAQAGGDGR